MKKDEINYLLKATSSYERRAKKLEKNAAAAAAAAPVAAAGAAAGGIMSTISAIGGWVGLAMTAHYVIGMLTGASQDISKAKSVEEACNKFLLNIKDISAEGLNNPVIKDAIEKIQEVSAQLKIIQSQSDIAVPDENKLKSMSEEDRKSLLLKTFDAIKLKQKQIQDFKDKINSLNLTAILAVVKSAQGWGSWLKETTGMGTSTKREIELSLEALREYSELGLESVNLALSSAEKKIKELQPTIDQIKSEQDTDSVPAEPDTMPAQPVTRTKPSASLDFFGDVESEDETEAAAESSNLADLANLTF